MSNIELIDLTKHYRHGQNLVRALDGVSLKIPSGQFLSIVGRSGSGKTTLLYLLGLLLRPTGGTILIDGIDATHLRDGRRADLRGGQMGFVFQEYNLLPVLNVLENVLLPMRYTSSSGKDARRRALQLLEIVGLSDYLQHRPGELSGGQQQRVALARALVHRPTLVVADEPTGAVDSQTAAELLSLVRRLNRDEGVTFVIVTHDLELAAHTDRVVGLKDGRIVGDQAVEASQGSVSTRHANA